MAHTQAIHKHAFLIFFFCKLFKNVLILRSAESVNFAVYMISLYGCHSLIYDHSIHDLITRLVVIDIAPLMKLIARCFVLALLQICN